MNKTELIGAVSDRTGLSRKDAEKAVAATFEAITSALSQGERVVEVLKQDRSSPIDVEKQVCIIYAVTHDYLAEVPVTSVREYERRLYERLDAQHSDLLETIRTTGKLEKDTEQKLNEALTQFGHDFLGK